MDPEKHGWIKKQGGNQQIYEGLCVNQHQQISENDDQDWSTGNESEFVEN